MFPYELIANRLQSDVREQDVLLVCGYVLQNCRSYSIFFPKPLLKICCDYYMVYDEFRINVVGLYGNNNYIEWHEAIRNTGKRDQQHMNVFGGLNVCDGDIKIWNIAILQKAVDTNLWIGVVDKSRIAGLIYGKEAFTNQKDSYGVSMFDGKLNRSRYNSEIVKMVKMKLDLVHYRLSYMINDVYDGLYFTLNKNDKTIQYRLAVCLSQRSIVCLLK